MEAAAEVTVGLAGVAGDRPAEDPLEAFCRLEHPKIVGALTLYCGDRDLAMELAQDTMVRVVQHWRRVSGMAAPSAWTHRVAMNLANSWFRRSTAKRRADRHVTHEAMIAHLEPDSAASISVRTAVVGLPPRQRAAIVLRYYADLSIDEVAEIMGCRPGTVSALTHQAIRSLREAGLTDLEGATDE